MPDEEGKRREEKRLKKLKESEMGERIRGKAKKNRQIYKNGDERKYRRHKRGKNMTFERVETQRDKKKMAERQ